jgi:hypothetical protein
MINDIILPYKFSQTWEVLTLQDSWNDLRWREHNWVQETLYVRWRWKKRQILIATNSLLNIRVNRGNGKVSESPLAQSSKTTYQNGGTHGSSH